MNRTTCPFLGFKDDPKSAFTYPSKENLCHRSRPVQPARGTYQYQYCLTPEHTACPLYQAAGPVPMPDTIASPLYPVRRARRIVALIGIPVVLATLSLFFFVWKAYGHLLITPASIPGTGENSADHHKRATASILKTPYANAVIANLRQTKTDCPIPSGWVIYTVNQTDSLFKLSAVYNKPLSELQRVNCMGKSTVILPGQVIYVPDVPTSVAPMDLALAPSQGNTPSQTAQQPAFTLIAPPFTPTLYGPPTPVPTSAPANPTAQPVIIPSETASNTPKPPPTNTLSPSNTPVPPTSTTAPSSTSKPATPTPTQQNTSTSAPAPTRTPRPSRTPKPTATNAPAPTNTPAPTSTFTQEPLPTSTLAPPPSDTPVPPSDTPAPAPTDTSAPPPVETQVTIQPAILLSGLSGQ